MPSTFGTESRIIKRPPARMKIAVVILLAALALAPAAAAQPNVILIVTDDQRWDTLDYMPTVSSELVGKGITFSNAFVVNPVCCPSRASILTGTYSHTNGVWGIAGEHGGFGAFADASTLPVWLSDVGYETMLAGKYLNGYFETYVPPGWASWFGFTDNQNAYFDYGATVDGVAAWFGHDESEYATDVLTRRAVDFIRSSSGPFFLYFAPKAPHIGGPERYVTPAPRHADTLADLEAHRPPNLNERWIGDKPLHIRSRDPVPAAEIDLLRRKQLQSLLAVDEGIADMLAALAETGKLADTLIVFTSDNGFGWGEHRRRHKIVPYEESIRVPLVIRWDALGVPARTVSQAALNVDLAETIAAAAGIAVNTEGRNLLPLILGEQRGWRSSFLIEARMRPKWNLPAYCGFRGQRWKYVQHATGEEELYDLARDPYELRSRHRARTPMVMAYRQRVQRSECRPPGYSPLPLCTRSGSGGPDWMRGWRRRDWLCAGRGRDRINVRRGGKDVVRCGPGFDRVRADGRDVLIGCELRGRRLPLR